MISRDQSDVKSGDQSVVVSRDQPRGGELSLHKFNVNKEMQYTVYIYKTMHAGIQTASLYEYRQ